MSGVSFSHKKRDTNCSLSFHGRPKKRRGKGHGVQTNDRAVYRSQKKGPRSGPIPCVQEKTKGLDPLVDTPSQAAKDISKPRFPFQNESPNYLVPGRTQLPRITHRRQAASRFGAASHSHHHQSPSMPPTTRQQARGELAATSNEEPPQ